MQLCTTTRDRDSTFLQQIIYFVWNLFFISRQQEWFTLRLFAQSFVVPSLGWCKNTWNVFSFEGDIQEIFSMTDWALWLPWLECRLQFAYNGFMQAVTFETGNSTLEDADLKLICALIGMTLMTRMTPYITIPVPWDSKCSKTNLFHSPLSKLCKLCCSCFVIEITLTWLPLPIVNLTINAIHQQTFSLSPRLNPTINGKHLVLQITE